MANTSLDDFLGTVSDVNDMEKERKICPEITTATGTILKIQPSTGTIGKGDRQGEPWFGITPVWSIDDDDAKEYLGRDEVQVYGRMIFLSVDENLQLDKGDNPDLAVMLDMFEVNGDEMTNGEIFDALLGQSATVQVSHAINEKNGNTFAEVSKVAV